MRARSTPAGYSLLLLGLACSQAAGEKALVFSQFTQVLDILERALDLHGYGHLRIDGSTGTLKRQEVRRHLADASICRVCTAGPQPPSSPVCVALAGHR